MNNQQPEVPPIILTRRGRDVVVPFIVNVASRIRKPPLCGRFYLKNNFVQLIPSMGQYVGLSHEDPQIKINNFLEISNTYISNGSHQTM